MEVPNLDRFEAMGDCDCTTGCDTTCNESSKMRVVSSCKEAVYESTYPRVVDIAPPAHFWAQDKRDGLEQFGSDNLSRGIYRP